MEYQFDFERLEVYQRALSFVNKLFEIYQQLHRDLKFTLGEYLCRTGVQIVNSIAEGSGKNTPKGKAQFYGFSLDSTRECIPMITLLFERKGIDKAIYEFLRAECIGISRMLSKLIISLDEKKKRI
jgi:four helix bundle protein